MRILVTGGAGFIGSNLCDRLLANPQVSQVTVLDDLSTGHEANVPEGAVFKRGSILDRSLLDECVRDADAVAHLAALGSVPRSILDPESSHAVNATGTLRVLESARNNGMKYVVFSSSSSVYGANPTLPKSEGLVCQPMSPYAVSKLCAESYVSAHRTAYGLPTLSFRFFNVFGPRQRPGHAYAAAVPALLSAAALKRPLPIHGDGSQSRDFTYVGVVVDALEQALINRVVGGPVNLALGSRVTLLELVKVIGEVLGRTLEMEHFPNRPGDVPHSQADPSLLLSCFPGLQGVALEDGVRATADWMNMHLETSADDEGMA